MPLEAARARDGVVGSSGKMSSRVSIWAVVEDMVKAR